MKHNNKPKIKIKGIITVIKFGIKYNEEYNIKYLDMHEVVTVKSLVI